MVLKMIIATAAKPGTTVLLDGVACSVKSNDISKTGKHGHAKCRIEAKGVFDGKKKVVVLPGSEKLEVPNIDKRKAQVLSVSENTVSAMDLESYETIDIPFPEDLKSDLEPDKQIEYWDIEGKKSVMKVN